MANETALDWFQQTQKDVISFVYSRLLEIIASVVFLVLITRGRQTWLNFMHSFQLLEGIYIVVRTESYIGTMVTGEIDESHVIVFRATGIMMVCWALGYFLINKSTDSTLQSSFMMANLLMILCCLLAFSFCMTRQKKSQKVTLNDEMATSVFYMSLLTAMGTLFHTFNTKDWGGYGEVSSHANLHMRLDFVLLMLMGVMMYGMPGWVLQMTMDIGKVDMIHALYARFIGAMMIGMAFMSARAANFLRTSEKEAVIVSHLFYYIVQGLFGWYVWYARLAELSWFMIGHKIIHDFVIVINAAGALDRDFSVFQRIVLYRIKAVPQDIRSCFKFKRY